MSTSQTPLKEHKNITPPSSFIGMPLTPPPTDEKAFPQVPRVLALFKEIEAGRHVGRHPWTEFQLTLGEYDEIERRLEREESLWGYVRDKIRYDYFARSNRLVVRMPTGIHGLLIASVDVSLSSQLEVICNGSDKAALFAQKVRLALSTVIYFPVDDAPPSTKSKHEPDASFWHDDAEYPGVIIEVSYSHKRKRLNRLAETYLLDSDASVQVVVGLDVEYGKKASREATLSVWRSRVFHTTDGDELGVVQEISDQAFRDEQGNPTDHPGLRLQLRDFACQELVQDKLGDEDRELVVSTQQLCQYLTAAETKMQRRESGSLSKSSLAPGLKKRKRSKTPPEGIASDDEVNE
ncbi:MAG: hypothetical protein M1813_005385 [Trichoglossum hirsutum]|nr:MAG: hypothetical protein M1813_005385 [Trichoglossum hirsutum]